MKIKKGDTVLLSGGVTSADEVEGTITIRIDGLNPLTIRADFRGNPERDD